MNILIIDDNEVVSRQLFWALRKGNTLHEATGRDEAQSLLAQFQPQVVILDPLESTDADESAGVSLVESLLHLPHPPIIFIITRSERKVLAARFLKMGVMDVFTKPLNPEEMQMALRRAERYLELSTLIAPSPPSEHPGKTKEKVDPEGLGGIISVDPHMNKILDQVRRIAPTPVSILITGETGTGKEIFAQAIHKLSNRPRERFVPLNCAVLSDNLVEDELFGHEKGAFTGAIDSRKGKFEYANKGTLFLDEIGDLSHRLQAKFLRVLQERVFERLGGNQPISTDFRLISATHRTLPEMVRDNLFREDLMFRINVVSFELPPLRERRGDIKLLAGQFLAEYIQSFDKAPGLSFTREVTRFMVDYPWPGNVRELKHFVERAVALTEGKVIGPDVIPHNFAPSLQGLTLAAGKSNYDTMVKKYKRQLVLEALETTGNNKIQTAQLLGISKSYLFKLIKQLSVLN